MLQVHEDFYLIGGHNGVYANHLPKVLKMDWSEMEFVSSPELGDNPHTDLSAVAFNNKY